MLTQNNTDAKSPPLPFRAGAWQQAIQRAGKYGLTCLQQAGRRCSGVLWALQPKLRIATVGAQVVYQQSDDEQDDRAQTRRYEGEQVAEGVELLGADDGDQSRRPTRWVQGSSQVHEGDGACHGNGLRQAGDGREHLVAQDADQGREQVSADQVAGLGQGTMGYAVDKDGRGPERADHEEVVGSYENELSRQPHRADAQEGPEPGPENLGC